MPQATVMHSACLHTQQADQTQKGANKAETALLVSTGRMQHPGIHLLQS